ncbi:molybdate ABC transporter substrate-binding protein [Mycobacterium sp. MYCO198283]|nr:molybdate ABC transporter substrate-binding protein [Mycobacterium sp. MYCO198283]MCG5434501.1 molybdate ABC transporter substrate-binding protein [Mycobacterium sp. MYCO198283]
MILLAGTACASGESDTTLTVFAAASLRQVFTAIGKTFEADHPGVGVEFSFAGSSDLVTQLTQGAPADVFASADRRNMDKAAQAGLLAGEPVDFASNTLTIVVAPGNPKRITGLRDLARPGLAVVTCAPQVPCGTASRALQEAAGVTLVPVSEESSVTDVLGKVTSGQADAGLVYVTDARAAGDAVTAVDIPEAARAVNTYPIAVLAQRRNDDLARQFVAAVTGEPGREVLADAGFGPPRP